MKKQNTIIIELNKVEFYDLEGKKEEIQDFNKLFGNRLFKEANSIEVSDLARAIHKDGKAEATPQEVEEIVYLLNASIKYKAWVQKPLLDYFNGLLTDLKNK